MGVLITEIWPPSISIVRSCISNAPIPSTVSDTPRNVNVVAAPQPWIAKAIPLSGGTLRASVMTCRPGLRHRQILRMPLSMKNFRAASIVGNSPSSPTVASHPPVAVMVSTVAVKLTSGKPHGVPASFIKRARTLAPPASVMSQLHWAMPLSSVETSTVVSPPPLSVPPPPVTSNRTIWFFAGRPARSTATRSGEGRAKGPVSPELRCTTCVSPPFSRMSSRPSTRAPKRIGVPTAAMPSSSSFATTRCGVSPTPAASDQGQLAMPLACVVTVPSLATPNVPPAPDSMAKCTFIPATGNLPRATLTCSG